MRRYTPTRVNEHTRWRFLRNRREELISRVGGGPPNERQAMAIDMLVRAEWQLFVAERDAEAAPDARQRFYANRMVTDARKQCLLWNRELVAASKATPDPAPRTLADIFPGRDIPP